MSKEPQAAGFPIRGPDDLLRTDAAAGLVNDHHPTAAQPACALPGPPESLSPSRCRYTPVGRAGGSGLLPSAW